MKLMTGANFGLLYNLGRCRCMHIFTSTTNFCQWDSCGIDEIRTTHYTDQQITDYFRTLFEINDKSQNH